MIGQRSPASLRTVVVEVVVVIVVVVVVVVVVVSMGLLQLVWLQLGTMTQRPTGSVVPGLKFLEYLVDYSLCSFL